MVISTVTVLDNAIALSLANKVRVLTLESNK